MQFLTQSIWAPLIAMLLLERHSTLLQSHGTVKFTIEVRNGVHDPVGTGPTPVLLINDSFIGPTLNLRLGEHILFTVINNLAEDTAIHFHGICQRHTPWSDGVPGVTQLPIPPGTTYTYSWRADEPGVYFYHAHRKGQVQDGLYGAIVIRAGREHERPFRLIDDDVEAVVEAEERAQPLLVSDWTQFPYGEVFRMQNGADIDWNCFDAIIINGVGAQYCPTRETLNDMISPDLKRLLADEGFPDGLTNKGCVPPIRPFQGDFRLNVSALPPAVYDTCRGGFGSGANYSVEVSSQDKWAALTFINPGGLYPLKVTIDNHDMWVYAVDGTYIYPVPVDQIIVTNGARLSVLIRLDQKPGRYMIRVSTALMGQMLSGFATLDYDGSKEATDGRLPGMDYAGRPLRPLRTWNATMAKPFPPLRPARTADRTFKLHLHKFSQPHGAWEWTLSGSQSYNISEEHRNPPLLSLAAHALPNTSMFLQTRKNEWVDIIISIGSSSPRHPQSMPHPMHKHGNKVFVLGTGVGDFPWADVEEAPREMFNLDDPPYRDSFYTPSDALESTWIVLRYRADQVGAWLLHCHVQTHLSGGMAVVLLDGVDEWPGSRVEGGHVTGMKVLWDAAKYVVRMLWQ